MTWKEIKLASLQKMFASDGSSIPSDGSADDYLAAMPYAANEAINMLATAGKYIKKSIEIKHKTSEWKYDLLSLADDFYEIDKILYEAERNFVDFKNYRIENKYLVMPTAPEGKYIVSYMAYPEQITDKTPDDFKIEMDPEVVVLIPLYIASELYKDDDNAIATTYRNEFEVAFERLQNTSDFGSIRFTSESGWI